MDQGTLQDQQQKADHLNESQVSQTTESSLISYDIFEKIMATAKEKKASLARTTLKERSLALKRLSQLILERKDKIIQHIMDETGKSKTDVLTSEIFTVLEHLKFLTKNGPQLLKAKKVPAPLSLFGKKSSIHYKPYGVVLIIGPWNYPFHNAITQIASALIAGNVVIFKPSEVTPLKGLIESLFQQIPLLGDFVHLAYGDGHVGQALIAQHPDKIFFTGSVKAGKQVLSQASQQVIPVDCELGGKDCMIVLEDMDLKRAARGALWGAFTNSGQSCSSIEHIYVNISVYESFKKVLLEEIGNLILNHQDEGDADVGSMTTQTQLNHVQRLIDDALSKGAQCLAGGTQLHEDRLFFQPTVLEKVDHSMHIMHEEIFGPLVTISSFSDIRDLVKDMNSSHFGLSASIWSLDLKRAKWVGEQLEVGALSINGVMTGEGNPYLSFGGVKNSGYGRVRGEEGLKEFCYSQNILIDRRKSGFEPNWYPYTQTKYQLIDRLVQILFNEKFLPIQFIKTAIALEKTAQKDRDS